jgi:hypothetical protein
MGVGDNRDMPAGRIALVALFAFACAHQPPSHEETLRYTVLMSTDPAGTQVVTTRGDEITVDYEYTDRGRGPKTHTVIRLDSRGVPLGKTTPGNH